MRVFKKKKSLKFVFAKIWCKLFEILKKKIDKSILCVLFILYGIFTDLNENNSEETKEILINT